MAEWYYRVSNGHIQGPLASSELKRRFLDEEIPTDAFVRKGTEGKWVPAAKVQGLLPQSRSESESGTDETADQHKQSINPNLIRCPDCGRPVSRRATSCPSCGHPFQPSNTSPADSTRDTDSVSSPKRRSLLTIFVGVGAVLAVAGIFAFAFQYKVQPKKFQLPAPNSIEAKYELFYQVIGYSKGYSLGDDKDIEKIAKALNVAPTTLKLEPAIDEVRKWDLRDYASDEQSKKTITGPLEQSSRLVIVETNMVNKPFVATFQLPIEIACFAVEPTESFIVDEVWTCSWNAEASDRMAMWTLESVKYENLRPQFPSDRSPKFRWTPLELTFKEWVPFAHGRVLLFQSIWSPKKDEENLKETTGF